MLFDAVVENDVLKLKKEIELGADIDAVDDKGRTALMHASLFGHIEIIKLLLDAGSNIHAVDNEGWTALMYASRVGHIGIVNLLLEAGSNIHEVDHDGRTSLMHASWRGYIEIAKLLLTSGADVNDLFKLHSFERTSSDPFYQHYIEIHRHRLTTENLKVWKSLRLKKLFV